MAYKRDSGYYRVSLPLKLKLTTPESLPTPFCDVDEWVMEYEHVIHNTGWLTVTRLKKSSYIEGGKGATGSSTWGKESNRWEGLDWLSTISPQGVFLSRGG